MSWWNPWSWGKGALSNPDRGEQASGPRTASATPKVAVSDERAMQVSAVFGCTRLLVNTGAGLPLGFYRRTPDGREPLDVDHPLCRLLKFSPNNYMTAKEFRAAMFAQRVLWGNGYAKIRWSAGRPVELLPLKPEFMRVYRDTGGLIYKYSTNEGVREFRQKDIFHLKGFSSDGIMGLSPLGYAREALGLSIAADNSAAKSVDGIARAVLETDEFPTDEQKAQLREMYGDGSTTTFKNGLAIVPGGMKYKGVSINPDDLQLLESRQFQVPEICRFFGVPAVMIDGAAGAQAAWPASYEQQVLSFLTFGLKPYLEEWEDAVIDSLLPDAEKRTVFAEHKVEGLLRTDSEARAQFYSSMVQNGLMTRAEVRAKENLPPIDGSDELTVQVNLTNLEDLPKVQGQKDAV